ncbi:hypothetical protein TNCT_215341 [Trichonephila clavata]|uniref:Uncharacterized protein n=1 Tax=Trichonephila clavata TaxID=2740835 RepID=A0A8X6LR78_TRICU|nr:hypothetical protein TNCT_215341 [Trichonephila clavata]
MTSYFTRRFAPGTEDMSDGSHLWSSDIELEDIHVATNGGVTPRARAMSSWVISPDISVSQRCSFIYHGPSSLCVPATPSPL